MTANTNPLTYNAYLTQVALLGIIGTTTVAEVVQGTDQWFNVLIPMMLNYAELRIQRDLNLLPAQTTKSGYTMTAAQNTLAVPVDDFVVIRAVSANINGVQTPLTPTSPEFLQNVYPSTMPPGPPAYFAMFGGDSISGDVSNIIQLGPPPDNAYATSIVGTQRLPSLNYFNTAPAAGTSYTFISTYLPDLLVMASMIYVSAYQRDFGKSADEPDMPGSYETQYKLLLMGANVEEARKQFSASGWSSMPPPTVATPAPGR